MQDTQFLDALADAIAERLLARMTQPEQSPELYTVEALAARYGVSKDTIRRRIQSGEFGPTVDVGKRTHRVTAAGVRLYDEAHKTTERRRYRTT